MSWLVDLAGKAESLLEKVDQTAANALQVEKGVGSDLTSSNVSPDPVHTYAPGKEKSHSKDDDVTPAGKSISKSNVNVTNSKYRPSKI